jgi:hypothetical protein
MKSTRHPLSACVVFALAGLLAGCASVQAPHPPSLELPKSPTDLRAVRKGDRVYLFWTVPAQTVDRQSVRRQGPTRICRSLEALMSTCSTPVGNVAPAANPEAEKGTGIKPQASFVDTLPAELQQQNPTRMITYAVEALNLHARSAGLSNQVRVPLAPTLPPPGNIQVQVISDGVVLTWDCETFPKESAGVRYIYRIYRRSVDSGADVNLAEVECPGGRFVDRSIEWQKSYEYHITVVTSAKTDNKGSMLCPTTPAGGGIAGSADCITLLTIEGDDSRLQRVFTNDVYPPGVPTGLQAVFSGPGQALFVDLLWAPMTDADLAGYNVYRREEGGEATKINTELVKTPAFRDPDVTGGKTYWYSISAVDARGNESARSDETSEAVPQPP